MSEVAQNTSLYDNNNNNTDDYEVGDTSIESFDGDTSHTCLTPVKGKCDILPFTEEIFPPSSLTRYTQQNQGHNGDWIHTAVYFDDALARAKSKSATLFNGHDKILKRQKMTQSSQTKNIYHTFDSVSWVEKESVQTSHLLPSSYVDPFQVLDFLPKLENFKPSFDDISSGTETVASSRSTSASSAISEESISPVSNSSKTLHCAVDSSYTRDNSTTEAQYQSTNPEVQQLNIASNMTLGTTHISDPSPLVVKKRPSHFQLSHRTSCETVIAGNRDSLMGKTVRHSVSKLDLIDNRQLTSFPLAPPNISISENDPIVFIEDYFVSESNRKVVKSRNFRDSMACNSTVNYTPYNYPVSNSRDRNYRSASSHLRSAFLLNTASSSSSMNHNRTIFKSQSSRSTSSSLSNISPTLRSCTGCQKPLYELSSRLTRDVSFTEFVCVDCVSEYHKTSGNQQIVSAVIPPGTKVLRRMPSSLDSLKMISLKIELLDREDPEWWSKLRKKLRWRWRLKGLIPGELVHYIDGFKGSISDASNTSAPVDNGEEGLEGDNSVEYHDHSDFDAQFNDD